MSRGGWHQTPEGRRRDREAEKFSREVHSAIFGKSKKKRKSKKKKSGCYIATATYGNYDCPQVWVLRRYRDYILSHSIMGKVFIWAYYQISPCLIHLFADNMLAKKMSRSFLDRFVRKLEQKGISNEQYYD